MTEFARGATKKESVHEPETVITVEDLTNIALTERRSGCEKSVLHEDATVQTAVYCIR
jgi:hypothetical protein